MDECSCEDGGVNFHGVCISEKGFPVWYAPFRDTISILKPGDYPCDYDILVTIEYGSPGKRTTYLTLDGVEIFKYEGTLTAPNTIAGYSGSFGCRGISYKYRYVVPEPEAPTLPMDIFLTNKDLKTMDTVTIELMRI